MTINAAHSPRRRVWVRLNQRHNWFFKSHSILLKQTFVQQGSLLVHCLSWSPIVIVSIRLLLTLLRRRVETRVTYRGRSLTGYGKTGTSTGQLKLIEIERTFEIKRMNSFLKICKNIYCIHINLKKFSFTTK